MQEHASVSLVLALLFALVGGAGCDETASAPEARIFVAHQLDRQGALELVVDGGRVGTIQPNSLDLDSALGVTVGTRSASVRASGAAASLIQADLEFEEQTYLLGLFEDLAGDPQMKLYGGSAPTDTPEDRATVMVVNFVSQVTDDGSRVAIPIDVYVNSVALALDVEYGEGSAYQSIVASDGSVVQIYRAGGVPGVDAPLQTVENTASSSFNARGTRAILLSVLNTESDAAFAPRLSVEAFATR